ncbi:CidA/LrgA family protein [Anaerovorax sp. IOR16]|uniref:CidA/LrgA family protein n=1 Tax=Anaerovorax sp. IOR16 TaxID=2773458 RepID=UPI0019D1B7DC|nr:CidA/LrgA family protein [Anaerovorax sp. IOR16]
MYIKQLFILLAALFIGFIASEGFGIPLPSNVIGLLLLLFALIIGLIKLKDVEDTADFIIKHLALFFVAPTVGLMLYFDLIKESFLQIALPLFGSIIIGFFVAGKVTQLAINLQIKWKKRRQAR